MRTSATLLSGLIVLTSVLLAHVAGASDLMAVNGVLYKNQALWASDCSNHLTMQADGNLVLYRGYSTPVWQTSTVGTGSFAQFQIDGNFVVYNSSLAPAWNSGTALWPSTGRPWPYFLILQLQTDGNLVLSDNDVFGGHWPYWWTSTVGYASHPSTCQTTYTSLFPNTSCNGSVIMNVLTSSVHTCGQLCANNPFCGAWTHNGVVCNLRSSKGTTSAASGVWLGEKVH